MTINASDIVALGPKRLAEVVETLKRREKLAADKTKTEGQVLRLGRAIAELDRNVGRIVSGGVTRPLGMVQIPPKMSSADLAAAMAKVLKDEHVPLRAHVLAERIIDGGYPGDVGRTVGQIARVARNKEYRFIVGRDCRIRLSAGALKPAERSAGNPKQAPHPPQQKKARAGRRNTIVPLVVDELRKGRCPLHAKVLAERITARGYRGGRKDRPLAFSIQSNLAAMVNRGLLRKTAPATFELIATPATAKV